MTAERNKFIINAVKLGECRKSIAERFGVTENAISKICRRNGVRARRLIDEDKKREIAAYRNSHTLKQTAMKFNITMMSASKYHGMYGGEVDIPEDPLHRVRVLKSVPDSFVAPKRVW